jgi:hypothetical protein
MWEKIISRPKLLVKLEILFLLPSIALYGYWIYNFVSVWLYSADTKQGVSPIEQFVIYMIYFPTIVEKDFYIFLICGITALITVVVSGISLKFPKPRPRWGHITNLIIGGILFVITATIICFHVFYPVFLDQIVPAQ